MLVLCFCAESGKSKPGLSLSSFSSKSSDSVGRGADCVRIDAARFRLEAKDVSARFRGDLACCDAGSSSRFRLANNAEDCRRRLDLRLPTLLGDWGTNGSSLVSFDSARSRRDNSFCNKLSGMRVECDNSAVSNRWDNCLNDSAEDSFCLAALPGGHAEAISWRRPRILPRALPMESKRARVGLELVENKIPLRSVKICSTSSTSF